MKKATNISKLQSRSDIKLDEKTVDVFQNASGSLVDLLDSFPRFSRRKSIARFLARSEIFKQILHIHGSIIECGVLNGGGLFTFGKLSSIYEPVNHTRRIIGFDTFKGFPSISKEDSETGSHSTLKKGGVAGCSYDELQKSVDLFDCDRSLSHIPKIELIEGDILETGKKYIKDNPHLIVALLYLDLDLYLPTKEALEIFLPRMPKGSIVAFDELNFSSFPGETLALFDTIGINKLKLERLTIDPAISYAVIN